MYSVYTALSYSFHAFTVYFTVTAAFGRYCEIELAAAPQVRQRNNNILRAPAHVARPACCGSRDVCARTHIVLLCVWFGTKCMTLAHLVVLV